MGCGLKFRVFECAVGQDMFASIKHRVLVRCVFVLSSSWHHVLDDGDHESDYILASEGNGKIPMAESMSTKCIESTRPSNLSGDGA